MEGDLKPSSSVDQKTSTNATLTPPIPQYWQAYLILTNGLPAEVQHILKVQLHPLVFGTLSGILEKLPQSDVSLLEISMDSSLIHETGLVGTGNAKLTLLSRSMEKIASKFVKDISPLL
jgi:hypothetical protein